MDSGVSFSDGCCGSTSRRRKPILRLDEGGISHGARRAEERVSKSVEECRRARGGGCRCRVVRVNTAGPTALFMGCKRDARWERRYKVVAGGCGSRKVRLGGPCRVKCPQSGTEFVC
jgi:hypothetical protein